MYIDTSIHHRYKNSCHEDLPGVAPCCGLRKSINALELRPHFQGLPPDSSNRVRATILLAHAGLVAPAVFVWEKEQGRFGEGGRGSTKGASREQNGAEGIRE